MIKRLLETQLNYFVIGLLRASFALLTLQKRWRTKVIASNTSLCHSSLEQLIKAPLPLHIYCAKKLSRTGKIWCRKSNVCTYVINIAQMGRHLNPCLQQKKKKQVNTKSLDTNNMVKNARRACFVAIISTRQQVWNPRPKLSFFLFAATRDICKLWINL
jgi:hypothetical protein